MEKEWAPIQDRPQLSQVIVNRVTAHPPEVAFMRITYILSEGLLGIHHKRNFLYRHLTETT
jgi:hypothetical protein